MAGIERLSIALPSPMADAVRRAVDGGEYDLYRVRRKFRTAIDERIGLMGRIVRNPHGHSVWQHEAGQSGLTYSRLQR